jgi:hypothetical protein
MSKRARVPPVSRLAPLFAAAWLAATPGCSGKTEAPSTSDVSADVSAEDVWLTAIGTGPEQLRRLCDRGATDRVATVLCNESSNHIASLQDLYRALRLDQPETRLLATTTHSLGLSARIVSAANPRTLVFTNSTSTIDHTFVYEEVVATGFNRGEQMVELVALDPATYEYNFYLLRFTQSCNETRCTAEDLLTERIESGWRNWSLYSDRDLVDTPLDCLSCHLPFGAGTRKILQMRQLTDPWMHWSDFRGGDERMCPQPPPEGVTPQVVVTTDGLDLLQALEGPTGTYAGVPVADLQAALSGSNLNTFLVDSENLIRHSGVPEYPYEQQDFYTREVLCERFYTGTSPTWDLGRSKSVARGLPEPYYTPDVLSAESRAVLAADRTAFLNDERGSAFEVAAGLIAPEAASAIGFVPRPEDSAPDILSGLCARCHAHDTDPGLRRAAFDAQALDRVEPATFAAVRARLTLPKTAPAVMPPHRVGELPDWAITRVLDYLRDHCAVAGACL